MPIKGIRDTDDLAPGQKRIEMGDAIKMLVPEDTPFTTFLTSTAKEPVGWPEFSVLEDDVLPRFDKVVGAAGTGVTIGVLDGTKFSKQDVVIATKGAGEVIVVSNVVGNSLTVVRAAAPLTPVTLADGDELLIAGSVYPEGSDRPDPTSINPTPVTGMTQIQRRAWMLTGTAYSSENEVTPQDWDYQAAKQGMEHKRDLERTLLFNGAPAKVAGGNGMPQRFTGGMFWYVKTNVTDAGGGFTEDEFNLFSRGLFKYGSKRKVLMGSPLAVSVLNSYPMSKVRISSSERKYGINVTEFVSPFGSLALVTNWEFDGAKYGGVLLAYDSANVKYKYLKNSKSNRDSHVETEIQEKGQDAREDAWLTECGLLVNNEKTAGYVHGITGSV